VPFLSQISGGKLARFARGCVTWVTLLACVSARLVTTPYVPAAAFCGWASAVLAADRPEHRQVYNLPHGDAAAMLPLFADASALPVVFLMDKVRGVQTNAVSGEFSPREAIDRMLAHTTLVAYQDDATGGFTVTRRPAPAPREEVERKPNAQPQTSANAMTASRPRGVLHALFAFLVPLFAYGQESVPDSPKKEPDTLILSPFTVTATQDKGYRATNSISGTRLDTPIKDLPLSLEVITSDFIRDTGALNLREALRYSPGIVLQSQYDSPLSAALTTIDTPGNAQGNSPEGATRSSNQSTIKIRGFITDRTLRDGLLRQAATDSINIDRVEVLRGPSALLYGIGNFGGVVNYLPKVPTEKPQYYAGFTVGSDELYRAEVDLSPGTFYARPGVLSAGFRMTGALQHNGDFTDDYKHRHWFVAPVLQLKLWDNTFVKLDTELGSSRDNGIGFQSVRSSVLTSGYPFQTNSRRWDFYTPPGSDPRTFRWSGADTYRKNDLGNVVLDLQQKFTNNLWLHATGGYTKNKEDSRNIWYGTLSSLDPFDANGNVVNGATATLASYYRTPSSAAETQYLGNLAAAASLGGTAWVDVFKGRPANFWLGDIYGTTVTPTSRLDSTAAASPAKNTVLNYQWAQYTQNEDRWQGRVDLNYRLDYFGHHDFLVGVQYDFDHRERTNFGQAPDLALSTAPKNSDPEFWNYASPAVAKPIQWAVQGDGMTPSVPLHPITWNVDKTWSLGYFAIYQGRFFNDRLTLVGGARRDRVDYVGYSRQLWRASAPLGVVDRSSSGETSAPTKISPQFGASFAINRDLSLFGVYSTGLLPNAIGTLDGLGNAFGPVTAKNKEVGLKFDLFKGKVSGSVSYFKIQRENVARSIWWAPAPGISAAAGGRIANYDTSKPTMMGFYSWGGLNPYVAWYASHADLNSTAPWTKIYPTMASILAKIPADPSRKWGGYALPLGAADIYSSPSSQAVDASGNPLGKTLAQLWTETVGASNLPAMPTNAPGTPSGVALNTNASNPWEAAWVSTYGLMVSDKTKNELAAQQLYDIFWAMNSSSTRAGLGNSAAQVFSWGGALPWLWAGDGAELPIYPGYWDDPNAQDNGSHVGVMNSSIGQNNAYVPFRDESKGFEVQFNILATDNLQIVAGWSHVTNKNTTATLPYATINDPAGNAAYGLWSAMGGSWGTFYYTKDEAYTDPNDPSTFKIPPFDYGLALDDTPKDTVTLWTKYNFPKDSALSGFGIGVGGQWESKRLYDASVSVDGSVSGTIDPKTLKVQADQLYTRSRTNVNLALDYQMRVRKDRYSLRFALNVDNLLNDRKQYGYIYAPGTSWRFTTSVGF
jgi:iron complex outermembrane receptor protein